MRSQLKGRAEVVFAALCAMLAACDEHGDGSVDLTNLVIVNGASDEALLAMVDAEAAGQVIIDDTKAAVLVTPEAGASVPDATPIQFAWTLPSQKPGRLRHGTCTGDFVWMALSATGIKDVNVFAVNVTNWTPDAATWAILTQADGPITVTLTYAFANNCILDEGPFRQALPPTFTIVPPA